MKVLALGNLFPSPWDPRRSMFNRQQFENLGRLCELHVVGAVDFRQRFHPASPVPPFEHLQARWFTFWHLPRFGRDWQAQCWLAALQARHGRWIQRQHFDCLLVSWAYPDAVAVAGLARRLNLPWVAKVHGSDINGLAASGRRRRRVARALADADAIVAVSEALADGVRQLGVSEARIHVLYNGVDRQAFCPGSRTRACAALGLDAECKRILYVGNLKASKGCLDLLDALPELVAREPQARLVMVGEGPDRAAIIRRIGTLGLGEAVSLPGAVAHQQLPDWFRASDLLCLPSHAEGVPNVVLEAMASGLPVVATRVGGIPEVLPDEAGFLVPVADCAALATALQQGLARTWDTARIVGHASRFDWSQNAERLFGILQDAVASRTH
ncbi:MAG: glycosyltransferase [Rhodanobacteraceae bacterium]